MEELKTLTCFDLEETRSLALLFFDERVKFSLSTFETNGVLIHEFQLPMKKYLTLLKEIYE